jgi:hypothetical protein
MKYMTRFLLAGALMCGACTTSWSQITVSGVTSKAYSGPADQTSFTVVPTAGYSYSAFLNGVRVPIGVTNQVTKPDYYDLRVFATNQTTLAITSNLTQFLLHPSERADTEIGLPPLVIYPPIPSATGEFAGAQFRILLPESYPAGMEMPVVIWIVDADGHAVRVNGDVAITDNPPVSVKRGVGSAILPGSPVGTTTFTFQIAGLQTNKTVVFEAAPAWTYVSGNLSGAVIWPENSRIAITNNVNLAAGATLTVGAGTIVRIGSVLSITNNGQITINGTVDRPVVFTPASAAQPWGCFVQHASNVGLTATGTIFTGSGGYGNCWFVGHSTGCSSGVVTYGSHRGEQALVSLAGVNCNLTLTDSAAISLAGQFGHSYGSGANSYHITLNRFLMHRVTTGGEYTGSQFNVNDSAFIECPDMSTNFADGDNDGLYIVDAPIGPHGFTNTLFGWTKDDGIDSGGSGAGVLNFQNCWFESIFHEANSLSGTESATPHADKLDTHINDVMVNCGQALEAGYGAPTGILSHCLVVDGMVGARYGDNYNWSYYGRMIATNSVFINNHHDAWCMNFQDWTYRTASTDIRSNFFTIADPMFPANAVWNPAVDGPRLAVWMTTPPSAPVGVGLAIRTNRFTFASLWDGIPVRLSTFTTNYVTVNYAFTNASGTLASGTTTFPPGTMTVRIYPSGVDLAAISQVDLVISDPVGGELTGVTTASFTGNVPVPQVSLNVLTNRDSAWRVAEGVFASLSSPSALPVSLDYHFTTTNGTVQDGTLVFAPLETRKQIFLTSASPFEFSQLQLAVDHPTNATLVGTSAITYTYAVVPLTLSLAATNQPSLDTFASGVSVVLNAPAATGVQVDYRVEGNRTGFTNGTLTFVSGSLSALLQTPTVTAADNDFIKVTLSSPVKASLVGLDTVYYVKTIPVPPQTNSVFVANGSNTFWYFRYTASAPAANWNQDGYDYSSWTNAPAQLGFGDNDENGKVPNVSQVTTYFRRTFVVNDASAIANLYLWLLRDDGGVVYINGQELYRSPTMPQAPTVISYGTWATNLSIPNAPADNTVDTATIPAGTLLRNGTNQIAVEIHQHDSGSSDISFDLRLEGIPKPATVAQPLYLGRFGSELTLAWGDATFQLLTATNIAGPWTTNSLATGTFSAPPTNSQRYYLLRHP